jgi:biotin transport system substrate-specific component
LEALLPSASTIQKVAVALLFVGLLVAFGRARFYLPDNPVPITLQTFGVLLTGGVLGFRWGIFAVLTWFFLGMAGVPVFKDGGNGWDYVSGTVTAGYILGFIGSVGLVGYLSQRGWNQGGRAVWAMLLGGLFLYIPALLWLQFYDFGWPAEGELFSSAVYPFIPGDLVKIMGAALVTGGLWWWADKRSR